MSKIEEEKNTFFSINHMCLWAENNPSFHAYITLLNISVCRYSVTYELTYHHFPNPINQLVNLFFPSTFPPYT